MSAGLFNEDVRQGEDPDLFGRIALQFPVGYVGEMLAVHHREAENRLSVVHVTPTYPAFVRSLRRAMESDLSKEFQELFKE